MSDQPSFGSDLQVGAAQGDLLQINNIQQAIDPDLPRWGALSAIGVWFSSVAVLVILPVIVVFLWFFIEMLQGRQMPESPEELATWVQSPRLLLVQVASTFPAHLLTLALGWAIVTGFGRRPFLRSLGWHWGGLSLLYRFLLVVGVVLAMILALDVLTRLLPNSQTTPFDILLKSSRSAPYVVAALAVLTAPLVEELIYRGVLYPALKKHIGVAASVMIVTLLFAGVHAPQYWGAWASLAGLTILSFVLTLVRAVTRSLLPCFLIHTLFNLIGALGIIWTAVTKT